MSERVVTVAADSSGPVGVTCAFALRGSATGAGEATWRRVAFRVYTGSDRGLPVYTDSTSAAEALLAYGPLSVRSDYGTRWTLRFQRPFWVDLVHVFVTPDQSRVDSVTVHVPCGQSWSTPTPPGPPVLSNLLVTNVGALVAGGTMDVSYTITAPAGAWRTDVVLSGGCAAAAAVSEELATIVTRTVRVPLPPTCPINASLRATVVSVDAAGRGAVDTARGTILRDSLPPNLTLALDADSTAAATFFASPTLVQGNAAYLRMVAADVGLVTALSWSVDPLGVRDSVSLSATSDARSLRVPLPPGFMGSIQARASAVDLAGNRTTTPDQSQLVLPVQPGNVVSTTRSGAIFDLIVDDARNRVYVLGRGTDAVGTWLFSYSATTLALMDSLRVADNTLNLVLAKDGSALFPYKPFTHILRVDLDAPRLAYTTLDTTVYNGHGGRLFSLANGTLVALMTSSSAFPVLMEADAVSGVFTLRTDAPAVVGVGILASGDGRYLFFKTNPTVWTRMDVFTGQRVVVSSPAFTGVVPEPDQGGARLRLGSMSIDVLSGTSRVLLLAPSSSVVPNGLTPDWASQFVAYHNGVVGVQQVGSGVMSGYLEIPRFPTSVQMSTQGRRLAMLYDDSGPPRLALLALP